MSRPLIQCLALGKKYMSGSSPLVVFDDLNFSVDQGELVAITGESGSGKSTLLHLLGLLDTPSAGSVEFDGKLVSNLPEGETAMIRNREFGFLWQINTLLPEFTAVENVMMPLLIRGISHAAAASAAGERLEEVGLSPRANHRSGELSGGEQQRVALARALVGKPRLLLADEPTGSLDEKTGSRIIDLLDSLHRNHGLTTLFVTHNPTFAARATRVLELKSGCLQPV